MILKKLFIVLLCAYSVKSDARLYHSQRVPHGRTIVFKSAISNQDLACPNEGFYMNPKNCSRFYRCVDYLGSGEVFSRYQFECPEDHVFYVGIEACVPGRCDDAQSATRPVPSPVLITTAPLDSDTQPVTPAAPPAAPPPSAHEPWFIGIPTAPPPIHIPADGNHNPHPLHTPTQSQGTNASPQPSVPQPVAPQPSVPQPVAPQPSVPQPVAPQPSVPQPVAPQPSVPQPVAPQPSVPQPVAPQPSESTEDPSTANMECLEGMYQQHPRYCNVYHPCLRNDVNYVCPDGSAFDFKRQMCRAQSLKDFCIGKNILETNRLYKTGLENSLSQTYQQNPYPQPVIQTQQQQQVYTHPGMFYSQLSPMFFVNPYAHYQSDKFISPQRVSVFK